MIPRKQTYALLAGLGVGAAVAMLCTPRSGEATRQALRDGLDEAGNRLTDAGEYLRTQADSLNAQAQYAIAHTRGQVLDVIDQATNAVTAVLGEARTTFSATVDQASSALASAVDAATGQTAGHLYSGGPTASTK